jgi:hypothetical protein
MNDTENNNQTNLPVESGPNPFEEIARQAPRRIVGQLLKFSKGDYLYGQDNEELPIGTKLIANMDQMLVGWIKWQDNKPVEQAMGLIVEGFKPMEESELPDRDEAEWELDDRGAPRDPWQKTYYLLMRQLDDAGKPMEGEEGLYTFTTSSVGGRDCMIELCASYGKWMRAFPGKFPVVSLSSRKYPHPNKSYGIIKTPKFEFNVKKNWILKEAFGDIIEATPDDSGEDEIPF